MVALFVATLPLMSASAEEPHCPFFKPECCSKDASQCNLPEGCSCQDFEDSGLSVVYGSKNKSKRPRPIARTSALPATFSGSWTVSGEVRDPKSCVRCTCSGGRDQFGRCRGGYHCTPPCPIENTCSFTPTSRTFNLVARESSRGLSAQVDNRTTLSGYRSSSTSVIMAATAYYSEFRCRANTSLAITGVFATLNAKARVDWVCDDPSRSCFTTYYGTVAKAQ